MSKLREKLNRRGFSLAEVLLVVAIIGTLAALAVPNLIQMRRNLRQKELDDKAEVIYLAVQNRLLQLHAAGQKDQYRPDVATRKLPGAPYTTVEDPRANPPENVDLYYITVGDAIAANVMDTETVDDELLSGYWIIEYAPMLADNGVPTVYAVYFSYDKTLRTKCPYGESNWSTYDTLRYRSYRLSGWGAVDRATVGYYDGTVATPPNAKFRADVIPSVTIENGEKLIAHLTCTVPNGTTEIKLKAMVIELDGVGNETEKKIEFHYVCRSPSTMLFWDERPMTLSGNMLSADLVLDDLTSADSRFNHVCSGLTPGCDVKVRLEADGSKWFKNNNSGFTLNLVSTFNEASANSLFADENDPEPSTAYIACGRHLQNLDESSGVTSAITKAAQTADVDFKDADKYDGKSWQNYYGGGFFNGRDSVSGGAYFKPIQNNKLVFYSGGEKFTIVGLYVNAAGDKATGGNGGLFGTLNGVTLNGVRLVDAVVSGENSGALAGSASNTTMIGCACYLSQSMANALTNEGDPDHVYPDLMYPKTSKKLIEGTTAGGLVGVASGTVVITNSFASTVIDGSNCAGGLVGDASGTLNVRLSYADSYLKAGQQTGGLVGTGSAVVTQCYAAGFQKAPSVAGFVNGFASILRSYSVCDLDPKNPDVTTRYPLVNGGSTSSSYYLDQGTVDEPVAYSNDRGTGIGALSASELCNNLGSDVFACVGRGSDTAPAYSAYKLDGVSRDTAYNHPYFRAKRSDGLKDHYGDWTFTLEEGGLVYYEKYRNGVSVTYGISGAGAIDSIIRDSNVVGDGYGVVYSAEYVNKHKTSLANAIQNTTIYINGKVVLNPFLNNGLTRYPIYNRSDRTKIDYWVFPLRKDIVNAAPRTPQSVGDWKGFYNQLQIGSETAASYYYNPHFAKTVVKVPYNEDPTVFAALVEEATDLNFKEISIRTPRHLYDLSCYYDGCFRVAIGADEVTFKQERNMNYSLYEWSEFTMHGRIKEQQPIGEDRNTAFRDTYDGGCYVITDVSFSSRDGSYVGMFGMIREETVNGTPKTGTVKNTVLATDYDPDASSHFLVRRVKNVGQNNIVHMGILAGYNEGEIRNCAVAGYYIAGEEGTLHAYLGGKLYAGGLVGTNEGSIRNSSADCPMIRLSSTDAYVYMGGFVGENGGGGTIGNSYAIGHLDVAYASGGDVNVGGFAGRNNGSISASYCAESIVTSGLTASNHGFAPEGGNVDADCLYLGIGTYLYVGSLHAYNHSGASSGTVQTFDELKAQRGSAVASSAFSYYNSNVKMKLGGYPYRAVVQDLRTDSSGRSGNYVHYGDWQEAPDLGMFGVFYWEHEEGGTNNGYHLSYLGTLMDGTEKDCTGTTLCTAHDDGGKITDFGYGYYIIATKASELQVWVDGLAINAELGAESLIESAVVDENAAEELMKQLQDYRFFPFTTRVGDKSDEAYKNKDYLYLDNGDATSGTLKLKYGTMIRTYKIAPFFANAMCCAGENLSSIPMTSTDGVESDMAQPLGAGHEYDERGVQAKAGNPFEVRSVAQLQYINWNYVEKNCTTLVFGKTVNVNDAANGQGKEGSGNYQQFPYLQYATVLKAGNQLRSAAEAKRPKHYWTQSHDLDGAGVNGYTPIAGMATSSPLIKDSVAVNILYAWFGGSYDGQSYKIQDLNVRSEAYSVGLFGVTSGADIANIILYSSDGSHVVERDTLGKSSTYRGETDSETITVNFEEDVGAYMIGGLIGIANDYDATENGTSVNTISNCAIAGYQVIDRSTNQQGAGTANVGGLIGLCSVQLKNCSAVTNILIACKHENGHMNYGSHERVGGLAGSAGGQAGQDAEVINCYTGGSIRVDGDADDPNTTLGELPSKWSSGYALRDSGGTGCSSSIYVAGMVAGAYAPNISNFTNQTGNAPDRTATISNCYTYVDLPDLEGTIRSVSLFAGPGDRFGKQLNQITLKDCYYLDSIADINYPKQDDPTTWPAYFFVRSSYNKDGNYLIPGRPDKINASELKTLRAPDKLAQLSEAEQDDLIDKYSMLVITDDYVKAMLAGDLNYLNKYLSAGDGKQNIFGEPAESKTFEALSGEDFVAALNNSGAGPWGKVSVTEGADADVPGKYSFSSNPAQKGKDYPFPTILTQKDLAYSTPANPVFVNVHYGAWPIDGDYWENGVATIDLFTDMKEAEGKKQAEKTFKLYSTEDKDRNYVVSPENAGIAKILHFSDYVEATNSEPGHYEVTLLAHKTGTVTVTDTTSGASFVLTVRAGLRLSSAPAATAASPLLLYPGEDRELTLIAKVSETNDLSTDEKGAWGLEIASGKGGCEITEPDEESEGYQPNKYRLTGGKTTGKFSLKADFTYQLGSGENTEPYKDTLFIHAKTLGAIGLSVNADGKYAAAGRSGTEDRSASTENEEPYTLSETPVASGPQLLLFGSASDGDLGDFEIVSKTAVPACTVEVAEEVGTVGNYQCRAVYVSSVTKMTSDVKVTITAKDPVSGKSYELSATVEAENVGHWRIRFDKNGATGYMPDASCGETYTLPECTLTKIGYTFAGWKLGNVVKMPGETIDVEMDTTLTAQWEKKDVAVTYVANNGTSDTRKDTIAAGEKLSLPQCFAEFAYSGHAFRGWRIGMTVYDPGDEVTINDNTTVAAVWKGTSYRVIYQPNGGTGAVYEESYDVGVAVTLLTAKEEGEDGYFAPPEGKSLIAWNTAADGIGDEFELGAEVQGGLTGVANDTVRLYAVWSSGYDLTLSAESASYQETVQVFRLTSGSNLTGYVAPARDDGWTLEGWYTTADVNGVKVLAADGSLAYSGDGADLPEGYTYADGTLTLTTDQTLCARWTRKSFVPVDQLIDENDNGMYLIVSGSNAMELVSGSFKTEGLTFGSGTVCDASKSYDSWIPADGVPSSAVWELTYEKKAGYTYAGFTIANSALTDSKDRYLRDDGDKLALRKRGAPTSSNSGNGIYWGAEISSRCLWTYSAKANSALISEFAGTEKKTNNALYYTGSQWTIAKNQTCDIFRQTDVYTFN